jgi:hypothetical protein
MGPEWQGLGGLSLRGEPCECSGAQRGWQGFQEVAPAEYGAAQERIKENQC